MPRGVYPHTHLKPKVYDPELVERIRTLYDSGLSQVEVAAAIGTGRKVVWRVMDRYGIPRRPRIKRNQTGPNNATWKGDRAGYQAVHLRVAARYGKPSLCTVCGTTDPAKTYDWANLTGNYPDPDDYARMCRSCHRRYDNRRKEVAA